MPCIQYQKSTVSAYSDSLQEVAINGNVNLDNISEKSGCSISLCSGRIRLVKPGLYYINANCVVSNAGANGFLGFYLAKNGDEIKGTTAEYYSVANTDVQSLSTSTIVYIPPSCACIDNDATITIVNGDHSAIYNSANLNIFKLA